MAVHQSIASVLLAALLAAATAVTAQTAGAPPATSLVGSWLVTIKGEPVTRTFIVTEEAATANGALLKAAYGLSDKGQGPVAAEMRVVENRRQLLFVTQADTKVAVTEQSDGGFKGSFTVKSGAVMEVTLARMTDEMKLQMAQAKAMADFKKPGADVPAECAAYYGQWLGRWSQGNFGELYLRIAEVKSAGDKCTVRYSYTSSTTPVPARATAEIKDGSVAFVCNSSTGGTCVFSFKGDGVIYGSYSNPTGGTNTGVFKQIKQP